MNGRTELAALLGNTDLNAILSWVMLGGLAIASVESVLDGDWVWVVVTLAVLALGVFPPAVFRDPFVMLPWEVLGLVVLPLFGRGLLIGPTADVAAFLSVAAVALVVAVELDVFTAVRMTARFAMIFVVVTTMATAGTWAVLRWLSDVFLGTSLVYPSPPPVSPAVEEAALEALMWDFVAATVGGVLAGLVFTLYFRRIAPGHTRLPPDIAEGLE